MDDSASSEKKESANWGELALAAIAVIVVLSVAVFLFINRDSLARFFTEAHYQPLSISTTPSGGSVVLDGKEVGTSPVTVRTAPGPHTVLVRKAGFKEHSIALSLERDRYERGEGRAIKLVQAAEPWIVNVELQPDDQHIAQTSSHSSVSEALGNQVAPQTPVESIKPSPPDGRTSVPIETRLVILEERLTATNERVDFAVMLKLAIIAVVVAIFLALGLQAFVNLRK